MQYNDAFYRVIKIKTYFKEVNLFVFPRSIHIIFGYYFHFKQFYQPKHHFCPKYSYPNNVLLFQLLTISWHCLLDPSFKIIDSSEHSVWFRRLAFSRTITDSTMEFPSSVNVAHKRPTRISLTATQSCSATISAADHWWQDVATNTSPIKTIAYRGARYIKSTLL